MLTLLVLLLLIVGAIALMMRCTKGCSSCGCGAAELERKPASRA
jgi:hypothetical protein